MLNYYFYNFIFILPFFFLISNIWIFFIRNNFYVIKLNITSKDIIKNSKFSKKINFIFFLNFNFLSFFYLFLYFYSIKFDFYNIWFNHLKINNFTNHLLYFLIFNFLIYIYILKNLKSNYNLNMDYYFSILNLIIFSIILFLSNNLFSFLFLIELNSLIIFYKFTVSKFFLEKNKFTKNKNLFNSIIPKHFLNLIFFQYWVNFFSSILLMYFVFNIIYIFGSSEWVFVNNSLIVFNKNINIISIIFLLGFFLKIGISPNQLFKTEIYKGLPFLSIFFYTIFYFLTYFLFFILILFLYLPNFYIYICFFNIFFIIFGSLYVINFLFDINFFKVFLAYSTIINSIIFFIVILSYF